MKEKLQKYTDLVSEKIGGEVLYSTDDFFAEKENLIKEGRGIFIEDKYTLEYIYKVLLNAPS